MGLMKLLAQQDRERRAIWKLVKTDADRKLAAMRQADEKRRMAAPQVSARDKKRRRRRELNFNRWD